MLIKYQDKKFGAAALRVIELANQIIEEFQAQGFDLTLRQLYYQFVARDLIPNKQSEYKKLGVIINDGRLAGLVSWQAIIDRTRNLEKNSHWEHPKDIVEACAEQYQIDKWLDQPYRVEVWIEKDALVGVIEKVCSTLDVAYFSCRGYTSQSEMWAAAQRLKKHAEKHGQAPVIIHLGDHDPSGKDMTRDIQDRMDLFLGHSAIEVNRIALNMNQIRQYNPPPNPCKITDTRAGGYIREFGKSSWELDALEPKVLHDLIRKTILSYRNDAKWKARVKLENEHKAVLLKAAEGMDS